MSAKFEQLLDYLVNEEHEKANELFHEIVVEKSREIYETLLAEEEQEESVEEADDEPEEESVEEADDDTGEDPVEEGFGEEYEEEGYMADGDDKESDDEMPTMPGDEEGDPLAVQDPTDDLQLDTEVEDKLRDVIDELQAVLSQIDGGGDSDEFGGDNEKSMPMPGDSDDDSEKDDIKMGMYEGKKRLTREYVEKVGSDWEKGSTQKAQGQYAGAGTGDKEGAPVEGKSAVASGKNKPGPAGVNAANILGDMKTGEGTNVGTKPTGKAGGLVKPAQDMKTGNQNVPGGKVSVKGLTKVAGGHGPEVKGKGPGPVGSGTGDKAGQTSIAPETKKQFLKPYSK